MAKIIDICQELAQPVIEEQGYELVDVEFVKEGRNHFLRFFIDRPEGVDIDDCAIISEKVSKLLDQADPIQEEYILEISSPGAEKPLKTKDDIKNSVGKYVNIKLYAPLDGMKEVEGDLISFNDDQLEIEYKVKTVKKTIVIPYDKIAKIRLAIKF